MTIKVDRYNDGEQIKIKITGRFDFSVHREFRDTYNKLDPM
jgi:hypothetical protein